ncbi:MAG: S41 family peptidase [Candidatus Andersenbacteria bacterium]|nr:S41 family peptidase [Candidatus Andersenbacteria bacterium]
MNRSQTIALIVVAVLVGYLIGQRHGFPPSQLSTSPAAISSASNHQTTALFSDVWKSLHDNFIGSIDDKKLDYGAVAGMVHAAGDPYTTFFDPDQAKQLKETLSGSFSGIGAEMGIKNGLVVVIAPLEGSPAQKAGIKSEDIIVAVDKKNITQDMSLDDVVQEIRGPKGQAVVLSVVHKGDTAPKDISVVRDDIAVPSVKLEVVNNIAHISLASFDNNTASQFADIAKQVQKQKVRGVVLDLRDNPGGYLDSAVQIASQFLQPGSLVVSERGKTETTHKASGGGILKGVPVVVLINHGSASASEILAGALRDDIAAPIVGDQSFGKGSVQEVLDMSDGSSLKVTIAKWYTPNGSSIDKEGIKPTIAVTDDVNTKTDEQLEKAYSQIK